MVVSMVDATLDEVRRREWKRVGVLGRGEPRVYAHRLAAMDVACETIDRGLRAHLDAAIFRLMEGRVDAESVAAAHDAVAALRGRNVDGIIPGCTQVPLLLGVAADNDAELVNPAELLAAAAVKAALASEAVTAAPT
jgi:aspartate racemase